VYHFAAALFFVAVFLGTASLISVMIREYRDEILAALLGEMPRRRTARAWTRIVRVTVQPHPALAAHALVRTPRRAAF
jgi:hypothetical protein